MSVPPRPSRRSSAFIMINSPQKSIHGSDVIDDSSEAGDRQKQWRHLAQVLAQVLDSARIAEPVTIKKHLAAGLLTSVAPSISARRYFLFFLLISQVGGLPSG